MQYRALAWLISLSCNELTINGFYHKGDFSSLDPVQTDARLASYLRARALTSGPIWRTRVQ
jgi:hypothetical protein